MRGTVNFLPSIPSDRGWAFLDPQVQSLRRHRRIGPREREHGFRLGVSRPHWMYDYVVSAGRGQGNVGRQVQERVLWSLHTIFRNRVWRGISYVKWGLWRGSRHQSEERALLLILWVLLATQLWPSRVVCLRPRGSFKFFLTKFEDFQNFKCNQMAAPVALRKQVYLTYNFVGRNPRSHEPKFTKAYLKQTAKQKKPSKTRGKGAIVSKTKQKINTKTLRISNNPMQIRFFHTPHNRHLVCKCTSGMAS